MKHFAILSSDTYSRGVFFHLGYSFFQARFSSTRRVHILGMYHTTANREDRCKKFLFLTNSRQNGVAIRDQKRVFEEMWHSQVYL